MVYKASHSMKNLKVGSEQAVKNVVSVNEKRIYLVLQGNSCYFMQKERPTSSKCKVTFFPAIKQLERLSKDFHPCEF
jgi:hypothetical protein